MEILACSLLLFLVIAVLLGLLRLLQRRMNSPSNKIKPTYQTLSEYRDPSNKGAGSTDVWNPSSKSPVIEDGIQWIIGIQKGSTVDILKNLDKMKSYGILEKDGKPRSSQEEAIYLSKSIGVQHLARLDFNGEVNLWQITPALDVDITVNGAQVVGMDFIIEQTPARIELGIRYPVLVLCPENTLSRR